MTREEQEWALEEQEWALLEAIANVLWFSVEVEHIRKNNMINYISRYLDSQQFFLMPESELYLNEIILKMHETTKKPNLAMEIV